ncbi:hypothetical protein [Labrys neptuniae]
MGKSRENIEPQAKLIEALAATMEDRDWASDIIGRCSQIIEAARKIIAIAETRLSGER